MANDSLMKGAVVERTLEIRFIERPRGVDTVYILPAFAARAALSDEFHGATWGDVGAGAGDTCDFTCPAEPPTCTVTCVWTDCNPAISYITPVE